jgi:hypothetical protein
MTPGVYAKAVRNGRRSARSRRRLEALEAMAREGVSTQADQASTGIGSVHAVPDGTQDAAA